MALDITSQKTSVTAWLTKILYMRKFIIIIIIIIIIVGVVIVKGFGEKNLVIAVVKFGTGCKHLNVRPRKKKQKKKRKKKEEEEMMMMMAKKMMTFKCE